MQAKGREGAGQSDGAPLHDILRPTPPDPPGVYVLRVPTRAPAAPAAPAERKLPRSGALALVGLRCDALTIGLVVELDTLKLCDWREAAAVDEGGSGVVRVPLAGWVADWERSGGRGLVELAVRRLHAGKLAFSNGDLRGVLEERPLAGCHVEVTFSAAFLATNTLETAAAYALAVAARAGVVREARLRRVDLAADVAGFDFREADRRSFVMRGRSKMTEFCELPSEDAPDVRVHGASLKVTGYTISPGGAVMCRVYDKREHLAAIAPEKREGEETIWRANGWLGDGPVVRVEFQLRSEALRSFGLVDPSRLSGALDALWQYLTREWVRLVDLGDKADRSRCRVDERWSLLQNAQFHHRSDPAARQFFRRGATVKHALGTWLSFAGAHGALDGLRFDLLPESVSDKDARRSLAAMLNRLAVGGAQMAFERLISVEGSARAAVAYLAQRIAYTLARSAELGGGAVAPPGGGVELGEGKKKRERRRPAVALWLEARAA